MNAAEHSTRNGRSKNRKWEANLVLLSAVVSHTDRGLTIDDGRDRNFSMADWIDSLNKERAEEEGRRQHHEEVFAPAAERKWREIVAQIKSDADKLSRTARDAIKDNMRINGRELIPSGDTLFVDNLVYPAIYLDVRLDTHAQSIHIHQLLRESMEGRGKQTDERLSLELDPNDQIVIKDPNGNRLTAEGVSKYVLGRFINR